jgi:hypothetical protein
LNTSRSGETWPTSVSRTATNIQVTYGPDATVVSVDR